MALFPCLPGEPSDEQLRAIQATHPDFSELPHHRAHSTSCSINQHRLAWLHLADLQQTKIRSEAVKKKKECSVKNKRCQTQRCDLNTLNENIVTIRTRFCFPHSLWNTKVNPNFLISLFLQPSQENTNTLLGNRMLWQNSNLGENSFLYAH